MLGYVNVDFGAVYIKPMINIVLISQPTETMRVLSLAFVFNWIENKGIQWSVSVLTFQPIGWLYSVHSTEYALHHCMIYWQWEFSIQMNFTYATETTNNNRICEEHTYNECSMQHIGKRHFLINSILTLSHWRDKTDCDPNGFTQIVMIFKSNKCGGDDVANETEQTIHQYNSNGRISVIHWTIDTKMIIVHIQYSLYSYSILNSIKLVSFRFVSRAELKT